MSLSDLNPFQRGYYTKEEFDNANVLPINIQGRRVAVIECPEKIPCNPCGFVCRFGAIYKKDLCTPGVVDWEKCTGCTLCVTVCPGMAIFLQKVENDKGQVTVPYELLPEPVIGDKAELLDRAGKYVGVGVVIGPTYQAKGDCYPRWVVTVEMEPPELAYEVRAIKILR